MSHRRSHAALVALILASATAVAAAAPVGASTGAGGDEVALDSQVTDATSVPFRLRPDFNGDSRADLAVGVRGENLGFDNQGAVNVIYGSPSGLTSTENQFWSQDVPGVLGTGEAQDSFGQAVGWADFDGDGFDDLAVGVPGDAVGGKDDAGAVNVIYGSATGLITSGNQLWTQASAGIPGEPREFDFFGNSLSGRDFNGDGFGDLAIGAFGDGKDGFPRDCGSVQILYGSAAGLSAAGNQWLHQLKGKAQRFDWFGHTLAAGDFDNDGFHDLAIGAPYEEYGGMFQVGAVNVMYGSATGLKTAGNQLWHQAIAGVAGDPANAEHLGFSLSTADFDGDNVSDLAIGIEQDDVGAVAGAGSALVLYGSGSGLTATGSQLWNQDSTGVADSAEALEGNSDVVGGDFDADGFADLAIGFQRENVGSAVDAGAVNVIYGTASGLSSIGNQFWSQDSASVEQVAEETDGFGGALMRADFDGDDFFDLAIGVPGEHVGGGVRGGSVSVLYGSGSGLTATGNEVWNQNTTGILDFSENPDFFGESVADL
jgi:hypothetical protein